MSIQDNLPARHAPHDFPYDKESAISYEDFCDKYMEDDIYEYISESCHSSSFKTDVCDEMVKDRASNLELFIYDFEDFNYDEYFHNWYVSTEKVR